MLRKQLLQTVESHRSGGEILIADTATVLVTSELPDHPIDYMCDGQRGPGSTRWIAEQPGDQTIVLAFDTAQKINTVSLEIEETEVSRTQEITLATSVSIKILPESDKNTDTFLNHHIVLLEDADK